MSIRVTLNCQVKANQFAKLRPFLEANLPNVRGFKGNRKVTVLFDEASGEMLLDEEWASVEHHQSYIAFISENGVLAQLQSFLASAPDIKYFKTLDI
ncbi:conserved hypothetical protein containing Dimeric alpha-beta barrel domain [Vibrio nigripulchritudo SOn1]|uniref:Antibiotic biosynthesis monooxygenase n=1 Tax=Vibrio nigripulchritudo SOn1 TaxID=1238450 RepID=A0AAV2VPN5_9VIBR|nr:hypothetical protein [Vibrio nigripulchritudo]CCO46386.1 conserved hypothetical protein containing Dimeric alpha-beta barrel domain [Vibrio nigripulchritudo SOn1]